MAVDVIVCAHNEERTVGAVVEAVLCARALSWCVLVADRCEDRTVAEALDARARAKDRHPELDCALFVASVDAGDKGSAMAEGLRHADTETVAFVDADLVGLTTAHVDTLLTSPPRPGMVVGIRDGWPVPMSRFPSLSGERRLPRRLAEEANLLGAGWEAEMRINAACVNAGLPWAHVVMWGVTNPRRNKPAEWSQVTGATLKHAGPLARMLAATRKVKR